MGRAARSEATIRRAWLAWVAICLIWGTTYIGIKIALETIPPFLMGGIRNVIAGLILAVALRVQGHPLPSRQDWGKLAVLGFFMLLMGNGGVVWGEQYVPSGLTAVLIGTNPFWMVSVDAMMRNGKQLWEASLPAGGYATPTTYVVDGRQYVVIAAGGGKMGTKSGDAYVAYTLPD